MQGINSNKVYTVHLQVFAKTNFHGIKVTIIFATEMFAFLIKTALCRHGPENFMTRNVSNFL